MKVDLIMKCGKLGSKQELILAGWLLFSLALSLTQQATGMKPRRPLVSQLLADTL